jgi:hypothetical protein
MQEKDGNIAEGVKRSGKKKTVCGQYSGEFLEWMPKVQAGNTVISQAKGRRQN